MNTNTKYIPNDYEQMLIAAGWITLESLDEDYVEYVGRVGMDAVSYEGWQSMREEWDRLDAEYERDIQPYFDFDSEKYGPLPYALHPQQERLLDRMSQIECMLGY